MKVLVVLVLVVFTGCNAIRVNAGQPKSKLDVLAFTLRDILRMYSKAAHDIYRNLKNSEYGRDPITHLEEGVFAFGLFADEVFTNLPPETKRMIRTSIDASINLASEVSHYMVMVKTHYEPLAERAAPVLENMAGELIERAQLVQDMASPYINELRDKLDALAQDVQARLLTQYESYMPKPDESTGQTQTS